MARKQWTGYMADNNRLMELLNEIGRPSADEAAHNVREAAERICCIPLGSPLYEVSAQQTGQVRAAIGEILANLMIVSMRVGVRLDDAFRDEFQRRALPAGRDDA